MRIIAGEARGRIILSPPGTNTRPTLDRVRENEFNMLQGLVRDSHVLDLFAGSGALSFEALSRGASSAVLVDHDRQAHEVEKRNCATLGYEDKATIIRLDWYKALQMLIAEGRRFDLVFLDPPYDLDCIPDIFSSLIPLLASDSIIVLEHEGKKHIMDPEEFVCVRSRTWGYCGISIFRLKASKEESSRKEEEP